MAVKELRKSDVMAHLLDALDQKQDIGPTKRPRLR
jgi:hypothetical protein